MRFLSKSSLITLYLFTLSPFLALADNGFQVTPSSLTFTAAVGKGVDPQPLSVTTVTSAPVSYSVSISAGQSGCYKLQVYPTSGITPATINVGAETQSLPAGTYSCTLTIATNAQGGGFSSTIPVTMNVGNSGGTSGGLSVSPTTLSLAIGTGFSSSSGAITLTNSSSNPITFSTTTSQSWLSVAPSSGTIGTSTGLTVTANGIGLAAGTYVGTISVTPNGGSPILVQVTLTVAGGPSIQLQRNGSTVTSVAFAYQIGGQLPASQTFSLVSSDSTPVACTVSQSTSTPYLSITPQGSAYTPVSITMALTSGVGTLTSGTYQTNLLATCLGASNQTLSVPVYVTVSAVPLLTLGNTPSTFVYQPGGTVPASQIVQVATTSSTVSYSVTIAYGTGSGWLTVTPSSGTTSAASPVNLQVGVAPTSLAAGVYTATVSVYSNGAGNSPLSFPVTLNVGNTTNGLTVDPSSLTFNYQLGLALPPSQSLTVTSSGATTAFTATALSQNCPGIVTVSPSSTATPATLVVSVVNIGLQAPQVCTGIVSITPVGGTSLNVSFTVNASTSPVLQAYPNSLSFTGNLGDGVPNSKLVAITSSDGISPIPVTIASSAPWLTVSPTSGSASLTLTATVNASVSGLKVGTNTATISVVGSASSLTIPVTFTLSSSTTIAANPGNLVFTQPLGGAAPAAQTVSLSLGGSNTAVPYSINVPSGGSWVTVSPTSGTIPGTISVSVNGSGLQQGSYNGTIQVIVPSAVNSPLSIPLAFTVTQPASLVVTPATLSFTANAGGANPAAQTLQVTSTGAALSFGVTTSSTSCGNFLSVTPSSGTTGFSPVVVTVSASVGGLSTGTCQGAVTITASGSNFQTIPVTMTVAAATPTITSVVNAASYAPGTIAPGEIVTLFGTGMGPSTLTLGSFNGTRFSTSVGGTQVLFDSGLYAPVIYSKDTQVSVVVPFEVAGRLQSNIQVMYNGQLSSTMQMRVGDYAPGIFTAAASGSGQGSIVNQNGTINGVSAPAARGSVVAVYVTGLGQTDPTGTTGAPGGISPLQTVRNVTATIGGIPADVKFAGAAPTYIQGLYQVNVQIPDALPAGSQPVAILVNGTSTPSGVTMWVQ